MATLPILKYPNPILKKKAEPVAEITPEITTLISDLAETMFSADGAGLAAPQVGVSLRVFVLAFDHKYGAFINPEIVEVDGIDKIRDTEGCLSFPGGRSVIERAERISVRYLSEKGGSILRTFEGFYAVAFQHELDHLNGILMIDRMGPLARSLFLKQVAKQSR